MQLSKAAGSRSCRVLVWLGIEAWRVTDRPWPRLSLPPPFLHQMTPVYLLDLLARFRKHPIVKQHLTYEWTWCFRVFVSLTLPCLFLFVHLLHAEIYTRMKRESFFPLSAWTAYPEVSVEMWWMVISKHRDSNSETEGWKKIKDGSWVCIQVYLWELYFTAVTPHTLHICSCRVYFNIHRLYIIVSRACSRLNKY